MHELEGTRERLFERYNTYTRRTTVKDEGLRLTIFKSFQRVLRPWLPPDKSALILDIGCGEGALLAFLKNHGYRNLFGFDISAENVALCQELGFSSVSQFDALKLGSFPGPQHFDVIFAMDLLEHLAKHSAAGFLEQIRERLRPNGYMVLQTPNMGSILGLYHRFSDLSHEFCLTEKSAVDLLMIAGFAFDRIEIRPAWNATTTLGYLREIYLKLIHWMIFVAEGAGRPRIPTKNLLIRARR
jgi:2-polyprenyl-3-methyl-5-hydroxy-6-metoxy-1,4-benzoquinol methylase